MVNKHLVVNIIIGILIIVNIAVFLNGKILDCDNCLMKLTTLKVSGQELREPIVFILTGYEAVESLNNEECIVTWNERTGYVKQWEEE